MFCPGLVQSGLVSEIGLWCDWRKYHYVNYDVKSHDLLWCSWKFSQGSFCKASQLSLISKHKAAWKKCMHFKICWKRSSMPPCCCEILICNNTRLAEHMAWRFSACENRAVKPWDLVSWGEIYVTQFTPFKSFCSKNSGAFRSSTLLSGRLFEGATGPPTYILHIYHQWLYLIWRESLESNLFSNLMLSCGCRQRCSPAIGRCSFGTTIITTQCLAIGWWNRDESMDGTEYDPMKRSIWVFPKIGIPQNGWWK